MNPFGAPIKRFMQSRGFTYRGEFLKFLPDRSLLVSASFTPVKAAFAGPETLGYSFSLHVFYPLQRRFFLVSPGELGNLRRDGTLRHVNYVSESAGIFQKAEGAIVLDLLSSHFDAWCDRLTNPDLALTVLAAIRTRAELPAFVAYLGQYIARSEEEKLDFARMQVSAVCPFDGGSNFNAYIAYLNAGGKFTEAIETIESALSGEYFSGVRHAPVVMNATISKLLADAKAGRIQLSAENVAYLDELGASHGAT